MVTPEQLEAALQAWRDAVGTGTVARMLAALEAAEKARPPLKPLIMKVQSDPRVSESASFHSPAPYVPQEPVTITRIVVGFPTPRSKGEE